MNPLDLVQEPRFQKGLAAFAAGYAKRMLEGQYNRFGETQTGKRLQGLNLSTKLGIEVALNLAAASLNAYEDKLPGHVWKEFLMQLAEDAPSEISKRILNGDSETASAVREAGESPEVAAAVLRSMAEMDPTSLESLLSAAKIGTSADRQALAQSLLEKITSGQTPTTLKLPPNAESAQVQETRDTSGSKTSGSPLRDMTSGLAGLNERLEKRRQKKN